MARGNSSYIAMNNDPLTSLIDFKQIVPKYRRRFSYQVTLYVAALIQEIWYLKHFKILFANRY